MEIKGNLLLFIIIGSTLFFSFVDLRPKKTRGAIIQQEVDRVVAVAKKYDFSKGVNKDIFALSEELGVNLRLERWSAHKSYMGYAKKDTVVVCLSFGSKTFLGTYFHEIGHIKLGHLKLDHLFDEFNQETFDSIDQVEADYFSIYVLEGLGLPYQDFRIKRHQ